MNVRLGLCVAMGVFVTCLGLVMLASHLRPPPGTRLPQPSFQARSQTVVDPATGEKTVYREITISTHIATPAPGPREPDALIEAAAH